MHQGLNLYVALIVTSTVSAQLLSGSDLSLCERGISLIKLGLDCLQLSNLDQQRIQLQLVPLQHRIQLGDERRRLVHGSTVASVFFVLSVCVVVIAAETFVSKFYK